MGGCIVKHLTAKPCASRRTCNKLREHGPLFIVGRECDHVVGLSGRCVFLRSFDGWYGWVQVDDVEMKEAAL